MAADRFSLLDEALYERHLIFDNVMEMTAIGPRERYEAIAHSVRDVLSQRWIHTEKIYESENPKRVYYLSMEFLIGRSLANNVTHLLLDPVARAAMDPIPIYIADSIIDATNSRFLPRVNLEMCRTFHAVSHEECGIAHAVLTILRSTIIGDVRAHAIELAENSIFYGLVVVARKQSGCVRFCYLPPGSRTPHRYECQPDLVEKAVLALVHKESIMDRDSLLSRERLRVEPEFNSTRYGTPTYCQLADTCADEITRGADDESEMGVFHDPYQPQRAANLRTRLDEYTPAGMEAGIIYAS